MSKTANLEFDSVNQKIEITGLIEASIEIEYGADVDFTELVSHLTSFIDTSEVINLTVSEFDQNNGKLKTVVETIQSIFEKYTESLTIIAEEDDDDLPFDF
ncbi:hypothetical protein [Fluviicola chungangensis]|uniref:Uncharacterized protein n=1 Tax=Fluviicola chungangensis TaxID=2597671 RepID=A0A556MYI6_9FLAO|nr:hypothetical protein [Fluviicola chungangensis]TSJ44976.1 hypothetical protein FO442_10290 [Fluviicola chungangensis]